MLTVMISKFALLVLLLSMPLGARQDEQPLRERRPVEQPTLTEQEWKVVNHEGNPVKRVRKLLEVGTSRLRQIRTLASSGQFALTNASIEEYTDIIRYTMTFIEGLPEKDRKRKRSAYKEFDLRIRKQLPILEDVRRTLPAPNDVIEDSLATVERLRIIALNRFSGDDIFRVPDKPQQ